jgi:hypothetical protein
MLPGRGLVDLAGGSGITCVNYPLRLDHAGLTRLVSMGPSARHITPQALAARICSRPSPFTVTVDLQIRVFGLRPPGRRSGWPSPGPPARAG